MCTRAVYVHSYKESVYCHQVKPLDVHRPLGHYCHTHSASSRLPLRSISRYHDSMRSEGFQERDEMERVQQRATLKNKKKPVITDVIHKLFHYSKVLNVFKCIVHLKNLNCHHLLTAQRLFEYQSTFVQVLQFY